MRTKLLSLLLLGALLTSLTVQAGTDDPPSGYNPLRKLGRGFANLLFGIVEVPNQYTKAVSENGGAAGATYGIPKGIARWWAREFVGIYEIVSFPVPIPENYKPIIHPEWPNEDYEP